MPTDTPPAAPKLVIELFNAASSRRTYPAGTTAEEMRQDRLEDMEALLAPLVQRAESAERERDAARDELKALGQAMRAASSVGGTKETKR